MVSIRPLFNYFPVVFQTFTIIAIGIIWIKPICCIGSIHPCVYTNTNINKANTNITNHPTLETNIPVVSNKRKKKPVNHNCMNNANKIKNLNVRNETLKLKQHQIFESSTVPEIKMKRKSSLPSSAKNQDVLNGFSTVNEINRNSGVKTVFSLSSVFDEDKESTKNDDSCINSSNYNTDFLLPDTLSEDVYSSSLMIHCVLVTLLLVQVSTAGITPAITMIPYTIICLLGISSNFSSIECSGNFQITFDTHIVIYFRFQELNLRYDF